MHILLHPFPLDASSWDACRTHMRGESIAIDLPGFGANRGSLMTTIDDAADIVAAEAASRGIYEAAIAGVSMGGYVALALARRHPRLVRELVLLDTRADADTDEIRARRAAQIEMIERGHLTAFADLMLSGLVGATTRNEQPDLVAAIRARILATPAASIITALRALASRRDQSDLLPTLTIPTTVVVGEEDTLTPPALSEQMVSTLPNARLARIRRAGHVAFMEQPASVAPYLESMHF